LPLWSLWS